MTHTPDEIAAMIDEAAEATENWRGWGLRDRAKAADTLMALAAMLRDVAAERDALRAGRIGDAAQYERDKQYLRGQVDEERRRSDTRDWKMWGKLIKLSDPEAILDRAEKAEAERDRLAAMVEKLRGYAVHDDSCITHKWAPLTMQCTCGLSDILRESQNASE